MLPPGGGDIKSSESTGGGTRSRRKPLSDAAEARYWGVVWYKKIKYLIDIISYSL